MINVSMTLSGDKRSIAVVYDHNMDNKENFHKIMEIVHKRILSCTTTKVPNGRCFHISGINPKDVVDAYKDIEKLN